MHLNNYLNNDHVRRYICFILSKIEDDIVQNNLKNRHNIVETAQQ